MKMADNLFSTIRGKIIVWSEQCLGEFIVKHVNSFNTDADYFINLHDLKKKIVESGDIDLLIIDSERITESLENVCNILFQLNEKLHVWIIKLDKTFRALSMPANLELSRKFIDEHSGHIRVRNRSEIVNALSLYLKHLRDRNIESLGLAPKYIIPVENQEIEKDVPHPPNDLAKKISKELAEISGSIHLNPSLLRECYVQMLENLTLESPNYVTDEVRKIYESYSTSITSERSNGFANEVGPDLDACARQGEVIFLENRFTYLMLGSRGCGKTTFVNYFFKEYIPKAYTQKNVYAFFIDFLRYDYVRDSQTLAYLLQQYIFNVLKKSDNNINYSEYETFEDYVMSTEYSVTSLLSGPFHEKMQVNHIHHCLEYLDSLLSSINEKELRILHKIVTNNNKKISYPDLLTWRNQILTKKDFSTVCILVKYFSQKSLYARESVIIDKILNQACQDKKLHEYLKRAGIDPISRSVTKGKEIINAVKDFLRNLSKDALTFLVIDNADRSVFPMVEGEILRTAWFFLPDEIGDKRTKLMFSMRTETYHRHFDFFQQYCFTDDIREVANINTTTLEAPDFVKIANARLSYIKGKINTTKDKTTSEVLDYYVSSVLKSKTASNLFRALFGGDHRRNLELFELAIASPHMVYTSAYYYTSTHSELEMQHNAGDYVKRHRLLTALMLGPWQTFRQSRSLVFLNVYNAQLDLKPENMWRNNLLIPRMLHLIETQPNRICSFKLIKELIVNVLGTTDKQLAHIVALLNQYYIIKCMTSEGRIWSPPNINNIEYVEITPRGRYYLGDRFDEPGLIYRLEYLQVIYWDTPVPVNLYYSPFNTVMMLEHLENFVLSFHELISIAEMNEQIFLEKKNKKIPYSPVWLSEHIRKTAMAQVNSIYFSRR